jgi:hypothetical protein
MWITAKWIGYETAVNWWWNKEVDLDPTAGDWTVPWS